MPCATPSILRQRRLSLGKTLAAIAQACGDRCDPGTVLAWETLRKEPRGLSRQQYASALEMSLEDLAAIYWRASVDRVRAADPAEVPHG